MRLSKLKLGDLIERVERRNSELVYGVDDVRGVSNNKEIMQTRADVSNRAFDRFQIIQPNEFVFNRRTTRMGERLGLGYNSTNRNYIFTEDYVAFAVKKHVDLLSDYLYIFFLRPEFDRYVRYDSWGSATEFFNWEEMCDVTINLPPVPIQQKYVNVYNAMVANQRIYQHGLDDLKLTCDAYIERLRREMPAKQIAQYIFRRNERNFDNANKNVLGLSTKKEFRKPHATVNANELSNYKIVRENDFAFVPTTDTWKVFGFGLNRGLGDIVVSPIYEVFSIENINDLLPEYLAMWLKRSEFDRYARYHSWGSARENFLYEDLCEVKIPIPKIEVQKAIVSIYNAYTKRHEINVKLKEKLKEICPVLIKASLEEAQGAQ